MRTVQFLVAAAIAMSIVGEPLVAQSQTAEPSAEAAPIATPDHTETPPPLVESVPAPAANPVAVQDSTSTSADPEVDKPLRWAGTTFSTRFSTSLATLGAGDYTSFSARFVGIGFNLSGGYFIIAEPRHQLRISTNVNVSFINAKADATDGSTPLLEDVPLRLSYTSLVRSSGQGHGIGGLAAMTDPTLRFSKGAHRTWIGAGTSLAFPTSKTGRDLDKYVDLAVDAGIDQQIRLRDDENAAFAYLLVSLGESWRHTFANDQTVGIFVDGNNHFRHSLSLLTTIYGNLQFAMGFSLRQTFYPTLDSTKCVDVGSGCINPPTTRAEVRNTEFRFGFSYLFTPEFGMALGYNRYSSTREVLWKPNNPFYSPYATIHASAILSFDRLYERLSHRSASNK